MAEVLQCGVAKALLGKAVLPDDLPYVTGSIGLLGTKPSYDMMQSCDTLLMVGSSFPYPEFLPKPGQARGVQIDIDARMLGIRYPFELNLVGDSAETLRALLPMLKPRERSAWRDRLESGIASHWHEIDRVAHTPAKPINPELLFWELSRQLPDRAILTCDSGSSATWYARDVRIRRGMMASLSGNLATMGPGVPYAIAAKFAFPDRVAVAMVGDGAMQMNGMNESAHHRQGTGMNGRTSAWVVLVLNNCDLNMVSWEQRILEGDPRFPASQELPPCSYAAFAESVGLTGLRVEVPGQIEPALTAAFSATRPVVIDAVVDPDVPPLPPHITLKQARNFIASALRDERGGRMASQSFRSLLAKLQARHTPVPPPRPPRRPPARKVIEAPDRQDCRPGLPTRRCSAWSALSMPRHARGSHDHAQ